MTVFTTLREANRARQAEWDKEAQISLSYRGNELAGETGEACNVMKKIERERLGIRGSRATVADLGDELADVVICADLCAMAEGIDLDEAVARKFNMTSDKVGLATRMADPLYSRAEALVEWIIRIERSFRLVAASLEGAPIGAGAQSELLSLKAALHMAANGQSPPGWEHSREAGEGWIAHG